MLEITSKKMVKTRKEHECFGCGELIPKGEKAVSATAKEDDRHKRFHLHTKCNQAIVRNKIIVYKNCVVDLKEEAERMKTGFDFE